ncbi:MAG: Maf family protein, partial [Cyanobacteriota bacterium]
MLPPFVLASASPARRRLLQLAGIEPIVYPSAFDESQVREPNA